MVGVVLFVGPLQASAQFNPEINYQGKLTNATGVAVPDGTYNINFWLVPSSGGATSTAVWSEARTGGNQVQVTDGLFSVMLGEVSTLDSVDFNQTLYLAVEIGGTGSPAWDGELLPRKIIGAVPAAFVAETATNADNASALGGVASSSFLRSDEADTMTASSSSSLLTMVQNGIGKILSLFSGATEVFTVLNNGNVGVGTSTPNAKLTLSAASANNIQLSQTSGGAGVGSTISYDQLSSPRTSLGFGTLSGGAGYIALSTGAGVLSETMRIVSGNVGIGTTTPSYKLDVAGALRASSTSNSVFGNGVTGGLSIGDSTLTKTSGSYFQFGSGINVTSGNVGAPTLSFTADTNTGIYNPSADALSVVTAGIDRLYVSNGGNVGIGTSTPNAKLTVSAGADATIANFYNNSGSVFFNSSSFNEIVSRNSINSAYQGFGIRAQGGPQLYVSTNGNIGIGTTTPAGTLDITSSSSTTPLIINKAAQSGVRERLMTVKLLDNANNSFFINNGTIVDGGFAPVFGGYTDSSTTWTLGLGGYVPSSADASDSSLFGLVDLALFRTTSSSDPLNGTLSSVSNRKLFTVRNNDDVAFTVAAGGNVGIGTTTPSSKLSVVGDIYATGAFRDSNNAAGTAGRILQTTGTGTQWVATSTLGLGGISTFLGLSDTPGSFTANRIPFTNSGATALTDSASFVFDGTNLGIGTSTPAANLHIYAGTGNALSRITWSDTTAEGGLIFYQGSNYYGGLEAFSSSFATVSYRNSLMLTAARSDLGSIMFRTRTSDVYQERMILTNSGNLGIGTTSPSQMLTVGGTTGSQFLVSSAGVVTDGTWSADTIAATRGGTGLSTITQNQLLIGGAGNTWSQIATSSLGLSASFTTSAGLAALLSDEVGTGGGFVRASSTMLTSPNIVGATLSGTISGGTFSGGTWQGNAIANAYLDSAVILGTEIDSSSELLTLVTDETGTGALVFAGSPTFTGTITAASSTLSGNLSVAGTSTLATTTISNLTLAQALAITSGGTGATTASGARTNLGATTVGSNIFTLANPSAVTLLRINADNTVSAVATSTLGLSSAFTTSAQLAALLSDETGTGASVFNTSPTFSTQLTVPQIVGGTTTASSLSLKSTSGVGSSDYIQFLVGNNGATESMRITTDGSVAIGSTASSARLSVQGVSGSGVDTFRVASSTGATTLAMLANGNLELPGQLISAGVKWQPITDTTPNNGSWSTLAYGNGRFVALSYSGSVVLMSSLDGNNWATSTVLGDDDDWMNLTYGNGLFVAVGQGGDRVMTSPDGINWTARSAVGNNDSWYSVTYGNGLFVAVGYSGDRVMTSPDGINWTARSAVGNNDSWQSVTYGNGLFTAVGWSGDRVMTSPDGINWTARSAAGDDDAWSSVTYGNGLFVAVGDATATGDPIMTSPDGINWTARSAAGDDDLWDDVTYGNGLFVAVGQLNSFTMTSPDGINWTVRTNLGAWRSVTYGNGRFVAVSGSTPRVSISGVLDYVHFADNNIYQGGMSVFGGLGLGTSTDTTASLFVQGENGKNVFTAASSTGSSLLTVTGAGYVGVGTTTPSSKLTVVGDFYATGAFRDSTNASGTAGMVLQTTGTGTQWVATSTLGISGGASTFLGLSDTPSSYIANRIMYTNSGATALVDSADFTYNGTDFGLGGDDGIAFGGTRVFSASTTMDNYLIGNSAGAGLTTGNTNIGIGTYAIRNVTSGSANNAVGNSSLYNLIDGTNNNTFGFAAGFNLVSGNVNTLIGEHAGSELVNSNYNTFVGGYAGRNLATSSESVVIGSDAAHGIGGLYQANNLTVLGALAGYNMETGADNNILIGYLAADNLTSGANNLVIGYDVDIASTTGSNQLNIGNLIFGTGVDGTGMTLSSGNVGIGTTTPGSKLTVAGDLSLTGSINFDGNRYITASTTTGSITFGLNAGANFNSSTTNNVAIGLAAGQYASTTNVGTNNFIGYQAGYNNTGSINNIIGSNAGYGNTGSNNNIIGVLAGGSNTGSYNNLLGYWAGRLNTGSYNDIIGFRAGYNNNGDLNQIIGYQTGRFIQSTSSVLVGGEAFYGGSTFQAINNVALGYRAGYAAQTGADNNILLGYQAADNLTTGNNNIVIGYDIDLTTATADNTLNIGNLIFGTSVDGTGTTLSSGNIGIGTTTPGSKLTVAGDIALTNNLNLLPTTGSSVGVVTVDGTRFIHGYTVDDTYGENNFFGRGAGNFTLGSSTDQFLGINNLGVGNSALTSLTTGSANTAIGQLSLSSLTDAYGNTALGSYSLSSNTTGDSNTAVGESAMWQNTTGQRNAAFGSAALSANTTGESNIAFGYRALQNNQTGSENVAIGYQSLGEIVSTGNNTAVGHFALLSATSSNNTAMGSYAGQDITSGEGNTILGNYTGLGITTGSYNTILGANVTGLSASLSNNIIIADGQGNQRINVDSNGNVGIATTTPGSRLALERLAFTGSGTAGLNQYIQSTNSTLDAVQFGSQLYMYASNTATTTMVGSMLKLADNTTFGNTVRGFEVQTDRGTNTQGENTALSGFARTFGVRGVTEGDAGAVYEPAGVFGETQGTTQGNAIRGYSSTITSASLLKLFQDTSAFTGAGLLMNFGNSGGSFSSTTASRFIDLQNAGSSMFTVGAYGMTTIGDGTTVHNAGLQIGYGGLCVDNDGSCNASTTGRISAVSYHTGNSDLAETYFSNDNLKTGEVVSLAGELSITRANESNQDKVLGVVTTKPGLLLGSDDTSLNTNEEGYGVALAGRVPVRLSNENGDIKAGDRLMLSSVPGVAMKASSTGMVVGIALEDFTPTRAYSDTYINQFGDDLVDPVVTPINPYSDPRINDGCYYGGGNQSGEEPCIPLVSTTTDAQVQEAQALAEAEAQAEALEALKYVQSERVTLTSGEEVRVGQIVMFVSLEERYIDEDGIAMLAALVAAPTVTGEVEGETIWSRLVTLAQNFVDGVLSVLTLKADKIETSELCVDGVCVNADDLRTLLEGNNAPEEAASENPPEETPPPVEEPEVSPEPIDTLEEPEPEPDVIEEGQEGETPPESTEGPTEIIEDPVVEEEIVEEEIVEESPEPEPVETTPETEPVPENTPEPEPSPAP